MKKFIAALFATFALSTMALATPQPVQVTPEVSVSTPTPLTCFGGIAEAYDPERFAELVEKEGVSILYMNITSTNYLEIYIDLRGMVGHDVNKPVLLMVFGPDRCFVMIRELTETETRDMTGMSLAKE